MFIPAETQSPNEIMLWEKEAGHGEQDEVNFCRHIIT